MAEKQGTNWTTIIVVVLLVLLAYILWDAYVSEDPLTQVAKGFDSTLDRTSEVVTDSADVVVGATADVIGGVVTGAGRVVGGVFTGAGRVLVGAVNAVGDTLIFTGEAIRIDRNGNAKLVDQNGNETPISNEEARNLMVETEARAQEQVRAATEAGVLPSPMEGEMNQDVSDVMAAEEEVDSKVMDVADGPTEVPSPPSANHLN